ncbi:MAG: hypothetical protein ACC661_06180 [Verrucomicrobiales bacterium]
MAVYSSQRQRASPLFDIALLLFRLGCSAVLLVGHSWNNAVLGWNYLWKGMPWPLVEKLHDAGLPLPALFGAAAAVACFAAPVGVALGFLSRLFALLAILVLVGLLLLPLGAEGDQIQELVMLYLLSFGLILLLGGGSYSLDTLFRKRKSA